MERTEQNPIWIGTASGVRPHRIWPVIFKHENGYEPGIRHEVGGDIWVDEGPRRMSLHDAADFARLQATGSTTLNG